LRLGLAATQGVARQVVVSSAGAAALEPLNFGLDLGIASKKGRSCWQQHETHA
jgi:hypothetical protein